jgi:hypothetical protein
LREKRYKEAEFLFRSLHTKAFSDWLNYTLEEQHAGLSLYFSGLPCGKSSAVRHWLDSEPYHRFIPPSASPAEDRLFVADLKILLRAPRQISGQSRSGKLLFDDRNSRVAR